MSISSVRAQDVYAQGSPDPCSLPSCSVVPPPTLAAPSHASSLDLATKPMVDWVALTSRMLARAARSRGLAIDPDDLAQETWLRLYSRRGGVPSFVNEAAARAYLAQIASNILASKHRAARCDRRAAALVTSTEEIEVVAPADTERDVLTRERVRVLARSLSRATTAAVRGRNATMLRALWLEGLSAVEVAERFGMSKSTVNTIVFRARRVLATASARHDDLEPGRKSPSGRFGAPAPRPAPAHLRECRNDDRVVAP
jgi:RNA polymerase sigma factor (sigma-70 family)